MTAIAVGFVLSAQRAAQRRHPKEPVVEGERSQNGWMMDGAFDGTATEIAPKSPSPLVAFLQRYLPFLTDTDEDNCRNYSPSFVGVRLRVPTAPNQFAITGRTSEGESFRFANDTTRHWLGNDYRYETYLPIPAVTTNTRWIDVIVTADHKQAAIWRVSNLPRLVHHDLAPTLGGAVTLARDCTIAGSAGWDPSFPTESIWTGYHSLSSDAYSGRVPVQVNVSIEQPEGNHYWKIVDPTLTEEWDVGATGNAHSFANCSESPFARDSPADPMELIAFAAIDPGVQHAVQVKGTVEAHVSLTDSVTFRNVPFGRRGKCWYVLPGKNCIVQRSANGIAFSLMPLVASGDSATSDRSERTEHPIIQFEFRTAVRGGASQADSSGGKRDVFLTPEVTVSGNTKSADCTDGVIESNGREMNWFGVVTLKHAPEQAGHIDLSVTFHEDKVVKTLPFDITLPVRKGKPEPDYGKL